MIDEAPLINTGVTPNEMSSAGTHLRKHIEDNHHLSTNIGPNCHHLKYNSGDLYYRHHEGKSKEMSYMHNNTQVGTEKTLGGDSSHIHSFMKHHIEQNGILHSANNHTLGSKNLWTNFIKKHSQFKYHTTNSLTKEKKKITPNNIEQSSDSIWGTDPSKFSNIKITAQK